MHHGDDDDTVPVGDIVAVREPAQERPPRGSVYDLKAVRCRADLGHGGRHVVQKLVAKPVPAPLVVAASLLEIRCGCRTDDDRSHGRERKRRRTSSQGMPAAPSSSSSSSRRSSSSRCSSVSGRCSGLLRRLSHSRSMRAKRSSVLSASTSRSATLTRVGCHDCRGSMRGTGALTESSTRRGHLPVSSPPCSGVGTLRTTSARWGGLVSGGRPHERAARVHAARGPAPRRRRGSGCRTTRRPRPSASKPSRRAARRSVRARAGPRASGTTRSGSIPPAAPRRSWPGATRSSTQAGGARPSPTAGHASTRSPSSRPSSSHACRSVRSIASCASRAPSWPCPRSSTTP